MTVLRALEVTQTPNGETLVSFEAARWAHSKHPFDYTILKNYFREWAEDNLPSLTEEWVDDGFSFVSRGVRFTNREDALMTYLAFK